jgi:hypothetical protein
MNNVADTLHPVEQEIISRITKIRHLEERFLVVLEGGYFTTTYGADEFTIQSQRSVFRVAKQLKRIFGNDIRIVFGVLGNDLGQICASDANVCEIGTPNDNAQITIPDKLQFELDAHPHLRANQLIFLTEKRARNRGLRYFREYYHRYRDDIESGSSHLAAVETPVGIQLYFRATDGQETAVALKREGWQWSSYCPLIMAQHYADVSQQARKLFSRIDNCIVVDLAFIEDRHKVGKGAELALRSYEHMSDVTILNVCFGDDEGELFTIDEHQLIGTAQ